MKSQVTIRFLDCLNHIKNLQLIPSTRQFALKLDVHPQCISDICTGKREVNSDIIHKAVTTCDFNPSYIFTGKGEYLISDDLDLTKNKPILTVVTNSHGEERIIHVPIEAQAGYRHQMLDPVYMQDLPSFSLPDQKYLHGTYRCFDINGDSMEPSLYGGDKVVCEFVEQEHWMSGIKNNHVYVVITQDDILVKRVQNNLKDKGQLQLISDNDFYEKSHVEINELVELWQVTAKISQFFPSPRNVRNTFHTEIDNLKDTITEQSKMIRSLNSTIEKLLKQNRVTKIG